MALSKGFLAMITRLIMACLELLWAAPLFAAVIERDWQTPGDGLLTYDNVSQPEWLDLSQTLLSQFPGESTGGSRAQACSPKAVTRASWPSSKRGACSRASPLQSRKT